MPKKAKKFKYITQLGERLKEARVKIGITQEEAGKQVDVSKVAVGRWEMGKDEPPLEYVAFISEKGEVTTDWLMLGRENQNADQEKMDLFRENRNLRLKVEELENMLRPGSVEVEAARPSELSKKAEVA